MRRAPGVGNRTGTEGIIKCVVCGASSGVLSFYDPCMETLSNKLSEMEF